MLKAATFHILLFSFLFAVAFADTVPWQPNQVDDFTTGFDGWSGARRVRNCGPLGIVLGSHQDLGSGASVTKTYSELPEHTGLFVELRYVFTRTWDQEKGQVWVDGDQVWNQVYGGGDRTSFACGVETHYADVQIFVAHTADSVTIKADSTIDQGANDESFGITNVRITPVAGSGGSGKGPLPANGKFDLSDNTNNDRDSFLTLKSDYIQCGQTYRLKSSPETNDGSEAFVKSTFTELGSHNAVQVSFKIAFMHAAGSMKVSLRLGGYDVWESTAFGANLDQCSSSQPTFIVNEILSGHTSDDISMTLEAAIEPNSYFGGAVPPQFAIFDVEVQTLTLGEAKWSPGPTDFINDVGAWQGPILPKDQDSQPVARTSCSSPTQGTALGSPQQRSVGTYSLAKYTDIPSHGALLVKMTYLFFNWPLSSSARGQIYLDDQLVWEQDPNDGDVQPGEQCGVATRASTIQLLVTAHTAPTLTIKATTKAPSQWSTYAFGILNPEIVVLESSLGTGSLSFTPGPVTFTSQTLKSFIKTPAGPSTCGSLQGGIVVTGNTDINAFLGQRFTDIPLDHDFLRISFTYIFTQSAGKQVGQAFADGKLIWMEEHSDAVDKCTDNAYRVQKEIYIPHSSDSITLHFNGIQTIDPGYFHMFNLEIAPLKSGSDKWRDAVSDFTTWPDGWLSTKVGTTQCSFGTILGGHDVLGGSTDPNQRDRTTKTFTDLPKHTGLRIQAKYVFIHTWDSEDGIMKVDDEVKWTFSYSGRSAQDKACAGRSTFVKQIDVVMNHEADSVKLEFTSTLEQGAADESFGVYDILIAPFTATGGKDKFLTGGQYDFAVSAHRQAFTGVNTKYVTCGDNAGTALLTTATTQAPIETFILAEMTEAPSHNALKIDFEVAALHAEGSQTVQFFVDGDNVWEDIASGADTVSGCGASQLWQQGTVYISHSASSIKLQVVGQLKSDAPEGSRASLGVRNLKITTMTLGQDSSKANPDNFDEGPDGWLGGKDFLRTSCRSPYGMVLGGQTLINPGLQSTKTYTDIKSHTALLYRMTYIFADWRDDGRSGQVYLDSQLQWQLPYSQTSVRGDECDFPTASADVFVLLQNHDADKVQVSVGSTGNVHGQESFAIYKPWVIPMNPTGGRGSSSYQLFTETFSASNLGEWMGSGPEIKQCRSTDMLSASGVHAHLFKTLTGLPTHSLISISFNLAALHTKGMMKVYVIVDNTAVWSKSVSPSDCTSGQFEDQFAFASHKENSVTVQIYGELEGGIATFAVNNIKIEALKDGTLPWTAGPSDFSLWSEGWGGTSLSRADCGGNIGWILGGHNILGQDSYLQKIFTELPSHNAVRIELSFLAIKTWDYEEGILQVDDKVVWSKIFTGADMPDMCQEKARVEPITIILPHTADSIKLYLTTTLEQSAADESWGITQVSITPFTATGGKGIGVWKSGESNFATDDEKAPWAGQGMFFNACGKLNLMDLQPQPGNREQFATGQFTDIPEHNALQVRMKLVPRVPTSQKIQMRILVDSVILLDAEVDGQGAQACPENAILFDEYVLHTGSQVRIEVRGLTTSDSNPAAFAVSNFEVVPLQLGKSDTYVNEYSDFSQDYDGWLMQHRLEKVKCEAPIGDMIGGPSTTKKESFAVKTYAGLNSAGEHNSLLVEFTYVFYNWGDASQAGRLYVNDQLAWSQQYSTVTSIGQQCGVKTGYSEVDLIIPHDSDDITLKFDTTQEAHSNERFGISQVRVVPLKLSGDGSGSYSDPSSPTSCSDQAAWNSWAAFNTVNKCCRSQAGLYSSGTTGFTIFKKQIVNIPEHRVVGISMNVFSELSSPQIVRISIDDQVVRSMKIGSGQSCTTGQPIQVQEFILHDTATAVVKVVVESESGSQAGAIISNVNFEARSLGRGKWTPAPSDFSAWPDGFDGTSVGISDCGDLGFVLGGHTLLGQGAYLQKIYTDLPDHTSLRVQLKYVATNTWDSETGVVKLDDEIIWEENVRFSEGVIVSQDCGLTTYVIEVDVIVQFHSSSTATLRIESTLDQNANDESFGILDVTLTPFTSNLGKGIAPFPGADIDFGKVDVINAWTGLSAGVQQCTLTRNDVLISKGSSGKQWESFVGATFTQLPSHNAFKITVILKHLHTQGKQTLTFAVDSQVVLTDVLDRDPKLTDEPDACSADETVVETFYTLHSGSQFSLEIGSDIEAGVFNKYASAFAIQALTIEPISLGSAAYEDRASNFDEGPDGWLAAGNLQRIQCDAPYGWALGGSKTSIVGSTTSRVFTNIPSHQGLTITMTVLYLGWGDDDANDEIRIRVNGQVRWAMAYKDVKTRGQECGGTTGAAVAFVYLPDHVDGSVSVAVTSTGSVHAIEAFALTNVRVYPLQKCASNQFESAPPSMEQPSSRSCTDITDCVTNEFEASKPTSTSDRVCQKCGTCPDNFLVDEACSATSNVKCRECDVCQENNYAKEACTETTDTMCVACATCNGDQFEVNPCTLLDNRECQDCDVCDDDQFETSPCTSKSNRECEDCYVCDTDEYEVQACQGDQNRVCQDCITCQDDEYEDTPCTPTTNRVCKKFTECEQDVSYEVVAPSSTSDRVCKAVTPSCGADEFESSPPTLLSDRDCETCDTCPAGHRQTAECSATSNTECEQCQICKLEDNKWEKTPCSNTSDTVCEDCTPCSDDYYQTQPCGAKSNTKCSECTKCQDDEFEITPCTATSNRICRKAKICPDDAFESQAPTATTDRECKDISDCDRGQFIEVEFTATSDRVCSDCRRCDDGFFISSECALSGDRQCSECDDCGPNQYKAGECLRDFTHNTDCRDCSKCVKGVSFEAAPCTDVQDRTCLPCDECDYSSQYMQNACTLTSNTVCRGILPPCSNSQFELVAPTRTSNRICKDLTVCEDDEFESIPNTPTSDRECTKLTTCSSAYYASVQPTETSDRECSRITICGSDQFESQAPTPTSNRVCEDFVSCRAGWIETQAPTPTSNRVCSRAISLVYEADFKAVFGDPVSATKVNEFKTAFRARLATLDVTDYDDGSISFTEGSVIASVNLTNPDDYNTVQNAPRSSLTMPFGENGGDVEPLQVAPPEQVTTDGSGGNIGIIAGAAAGGLVVLILIILLVIFLVRRSSSKSSNEQTRSSIAFENPMYDEKHASTSEDSPNGDDEAAYDDLPFTADEAEPGYLDVKTLNGFDQNDDDEVGYMDVGINQDPDAAYMDVHAEDDPAYMDVNADTEDTGYVDVRPNLHDAMEDTEDIEL